MNITGIWNWIARTIGPATITISNRLIHIETTILIRPNDHQRDDDEE